MKLRSLLLVALLPGALLSAQVTLPRLLSSHMVLQRDLPVHVWGMADPGEAVTVVFRGESRTVKAGDVGHWSLYLSPGAAGGPFQLVVKGAAGQPITLDDVLVGDVWVASGQSNMEFHLRNAATGPADLPHAANDHLRLFKVKELSREFPQQDVEGEGWAASSTESAQDFSAVGWYFAREIEAREHVPVGVIEANSGGTLAEAWTRLTALAEDAQLAPVFAARGEMADREAEAQLNDKRIEKRRAEARAAGKPEPGGSWHPFSMWGPGLLYNGMIAPLTHFPIRGVIWYQGETNSDVKRVALYHRIFSTLIEDWRKQWGEGDFPFLFVQLAAFKSGSNEDWAALREQQLETLDLRNTAMAVTIDIGNPESAHPTDKLDVGLRLGRAARALSYGEAIEYFGPIFRQATHEGGALRLWFDHAATLKAKGGELTGFEVAAADGKFQLATAKIDGDTVVVSSPSVSEPTQARYGWAGDPQCNLYNGEGLPASPFASER